MGDRDKAAETEKRAKGRMHHLRRARISTFIITEQTPLGRIHSGARVIGASRGTVKVNGRWRGIYPPLSDAGGRNLGSAKRHRVDQQQGFFPRVGLGQTGI